MDVSKAFSVDNGFIIDEENGGPFITGGTASPIGLDLPTSTIYVRPTATGVETWKKYNTGVNDWREISAQDIPYAKMSTAYRAGSDNVKSALDELRLLKLYVPVDTSTTLNGTLTLDVSSNTLNIIDGTATGYSVQLPDATTINHGSSYIIANASSESISLKDGAGTILLTLNQDDVVEAILEADGAPAGSWLTLVTSGSATGITSYVVESNTSFLTSSTTDVLITGFTTTPISGRYAVFYSSDIIISQNNKISQSVVFVDGVANENTRRDVQGVGSNFVASQQSIGEVTVNGSQAVDIRVNINSGSLTVKQRSLILIRLGSS